MKIAAIRNRLMRVERQNWHFVEVETDEGLVGIGEASVEWRERAVAAAVDELAPMLIGEDPNLIEHHWQRMHRHGFWRGGVILGSASSVSTRRCGTSRANVLGSRCTACSAARRATGRGCTLARSAPLP